MKNPLKGRRNPILDIMVTILIIVVVVMGLAFWALVLSYHLPWWVAAFVTICAFGMARMLWQTLKE